MIGERQVRGKAVIETRKLMTGEIRPPSTCSQLSLGRITDSVAGE